MESTSPRVEALSLYRSLQAKHAERANTWHRHYQAVAMARLLVIGGVLTSLYFFLSTGSWAMLGASIAGAMLFMALMQRHQRIAGRREESRTLAQINADELAYLRGEGIPFGSGQRYAAPSHPHSFDLDLFGPRSVFHHINRTGTQMGTERLASLFLDPLPAQQIVRHQQAVRELMAMVEWRQRFNALARLAHDSPAAYTQLVEWFGRRQSHRLPGWLSVLTYALPIALGLSLVLALAMDSALASRVAVQLFVVNLLLLALRFKAIRAEILAAERVDRMVMGYSQLMAAMEREEFRAEELNALRDTLSSAGKSTSQRIGELSRLFGQLDNINNMLGAVLINGLTLYHLHVIRRLWAWRREHAGRMAHWLQAVGQMEALCSLANFAHNNPSFAFPSINQSLNIGFQDLGHPLLPEGVRVTNSVAFNPHRFILLSGSNMSGKSTFLRSLGVNMVLAGMGAPVCATRADVHPLRVWVSMRLTDSLADHESYFLAEVKRLKAIMSSAAAQTTFVLLDEILRGTNSDDKRYGTMEVIRRLAALGAFGAIATHDVEVCRMASEHPEALINKCFEVELTPDGLKFDYSLREGVCRNRSATFLMRQEGVI